MHQAPPPPQKRRRGPSILQLFVFGIFSVACADIVHAQADLTIGKTLPKNPELKDLTRASGPRSQPSQAPKVSNFSGLSGPGQPVDGTGLGGYRTGKEGTMYKGPEPKEGWLPFGDRARGTAVKDGLLPPLKPIWDLHLRDTSICNGEDGFYYMTGSSGDNIWDLVDGIELWKSKDLQTWEYLGLVWSVDKNGTWEKQFRWVWAPEVHLVNHALVFTYSMLSPPYGAGGGTGIVTAAPGHPEGPYKNPVAADKPLTGGIDATIFQDDDGKIYFTNGAGGTLHLMKPDLSAFDGAPLNVKVVAQPGGPTRLGHEGASFFKANGKYYLGAADTYQGRYSSICGVADKVEGPYTLVHEAVPCGAGGNYFKDNDNNWWCTYFGNDDQSPWREKPGIVKIDFAKDHTIFVADEQPAFVLQKDANLKWRKAPRGANPPARTPAP